MAIVNNAECLKLALYAECHYVEGHYAECHGVLMITHKIPF